MSLANLCYKNDICNNVISLMKEVIKIGTHLNLEERGMLFDSYNKQIVPYFTLLVSSENSSEKLLEEIKRKAETKVNKNFQ